MHKLTQFRASNELQVFQVFIFTSSVRFTVTFGTNCVCILRNNAQHHRATVSRVCPKSNK